MGCLICERIEQIKRGENPYFVCELSTGYVVLGDHQRFCGYTLFCQSSTSPSCTTCRGNFGRAFCRRCRWWQRRWLLSTTRTR